MPFWAFTPSALALSPAPRPALRPPQTGRGPRIGGTPGPRLPGWDYDPSAPGADLPPPPPKFQPWRGPWVGSDYPSIGPVPGSDPKPPTQPDPLPKREPIVRVPRLGPDGKLVEPCEQMREGIMGSILEAEKQLSGTRRELENTRGQLKKQKYDNDLSPACRTKLDRLVDLIDDYLNWIDQNRSQLIEDAMDLSRENCAGLVRPDGTPSLGAKRYGENASKASHADALINAKLARELEKLLDDCGIKTDATPTGRPKRQTKQSLGAD